MRVGKGPIRDYFFATRRAVIYQNRKGGKEYEVFSRRIIWPKPDRYLTLIYKTRMNEFTFANYSIYAIVNQLSPGIAEVFSGSLIYRERKRSKRLRRQPVAAMLRAWGWDLRG